MHFDEGLFARHKGGESTKVVTKGLRGKSASKKLTEEGLVKFSTRVSIQVLSYRIFKSFDNFRVNHHYSALNDCRIRRCKIAEVLVEKNFDLAFLLIYEFNLPAVDIYASVAASLAERKRGSQLTEFFRNIKGTIDDDDWDQVLGATINIYANKHKEHPDRLIDMLTSSQGKVLACVICGRLKMWLMFSMLLISYALTKGKSWKYFFLDGDGQFETNLSALHTNALPVPDMC
ncbi:hypothetical protein JHK85_009584 [Glycine max]|nr:hypothetical protein JHK87_009189 [Glycine soja]KAG5048481.1 hypothetical protein JHK85_009584 [Glycine max]KAG5065595.1 hypothetical protein JHK86_009326 [Glycine max]